MYIGRVDDAFVFTHRDDVYTWNKRDGMHRYEMDMERLEEAAIFNDAVLVSGDGDEIAYIDEGALHQLFDGILTVENTPSYIMVNDDPRIAAGVVTPDTLTTIGVTTDWEVYASVQVYPL